MVHPFDEIFRTHDEAIAAFDILRLAVSTLDVAGPDDPRLAITYRSGIHGIHLSFCNWLVVGIYAPDRKHDRTLLALRLDDGGDAGLTQEDEFAEPGGEPEFGLFGLGAQVIVPLSSPIKQKVIESLEAIRERFKTHHKSRFSRFNNSELAEALFDDAARDRLLTDGLPQDKPDSGTIVRTPFFQPYSYARRLIGILDGVPRQDVMELFRELNEHIGTPQAQQDWSDPDRWIPEWMTGQARVLASRLWQDSEKTINPRHMRGAFLFVVNHNLLERDKEGVYHISETGRRFIEGDQSVIDRIDHFEGLAELLRLIARLQPARRSVLLPPWTRYLRTYSKFKSDKSVESTFRPRLLDLRDRGLISQAGYDYSLTEAGRLYVERMPTFPMPKVVTPDHPKPEPGPEPDPPMDPNPVFTLSDVATATGLPQPTLARWVSSIHRKGQAILYGPPGTGKTFVARHLADHLVGGGTGVVELVQFHPAYSYEDFVLGIRPKSENGALTYPLVPGRFLEFCERAAASPDISVMIIDEINRANLARVFGELMYLLEYRDSDVPLAGGRRFRIPSNVRLIGTMNTADRSIALVDHALRRRFAFLELKPNYDTLLRYHENNGSRDVAGRLVAVLKRLNTDINDGHYEIGISYFMVPRLADTLPDIWQMEIEPYIQEFFFDQSGTVDRYRWDRLQGEILGER